MRWADDLQGFKGLSSTLQPTSGSLLPTCWDLRVSYMYIYSNNIYTTMLQDALVLLDLIGAANPQFPNFFPQTTGRMHQQLRTIGKLTV